MRERRQHKPCSPTRLLAISTRQPPLISSLAQTHIYIYPDDMHRYLSPSQTHSPYSQLSEPPQNVGFASSSSSCPSDSPTNRCGAHAFGPPASGPISPGAPRIAELQRLARKRADEQDCPTWQLASDCKIHRGITHAIVPGDGHDVEHTVHLNDEPIDEPTVNNILIQSCNILHLRTRQTIPPPRVLAAGSGHHRQFGV